MYILYCSLFLPYLTYCVEIWGNTYPTNINDIFLLQKKELSALCMVTSVSIIRINFFQQLHVLKFLEIIELKTILFMIKAYHRCLPSKHSAFIC